jgi:hypothetical protein
MKFHEIIKHFGQFGYIELENLQVLTKANRSSLLQAVHRWSKRGWLIPLKRGFYAIAPDYAKHPLSVEVAANQIYRPSYTSGLWRLNQLGFIPEGVCEVNSATLNNPACFETPMGRFVYQRISPNGYFGYDEQDEGGPVPALVATPEKALLDFFWWRPQVDWGPAEFDRWRIQDVFRRLDHRRLRKFASQWDQPRLIQAADQVIHYLTYGP